MVHYKTKIFAFGASILFGRHRFPWSVTIPDPVVAMVFLLGERIEKFLDN